MSASTDRRRLCTGLVCAAASLALPARAQAFPARPMRLIVPFPPGGPSDLAARAVAEGLGRLLEQPVVVENKPGAGAIIGSQSLLAQPADGHTLMMGSNVLATGKALYPSMTFDPQKDFTPVAAVIRSPHQVVVAPSFPGTGIQDLIAVARASGDRFQYASSGAGTMPHLGAELFKEVTGVAMQPVPYRGSAPALTAVASGEVPVYFDIEFSSKAMLSAGRLRSLGVTSQQRSRSFPQVPTLDEQGIRNFDLYSWFGLVVRAGTPDAIVGRLNEALNQVLGTTEFRTRMDGLGAQVVGGSPTAFRRLIDQDATFWTALIRRNGIRAE